MLTTASPTCHSASVRLELFVGGESFSLRQVGPDFIDVRHPVDMAPCVAEVVAWIDGRESRRRVTLVDGMTESCERVRVVAITKAS